MSPKIGATLCAMCVLGQTSHVLGDGNLRVDAKATGAIVDGQSWTTAFRTIEEALTVAGDSAFSRGEIWVAGGRYDVKPGQPHGQLLFPNGDGIVIRGGYSGLGSTDQDAWDPATHPAVLNLSLEESGVGYFHDARDDSLHAVNATTGEETIFVGFEFQLRKPGPDEAVCAFLRSPAAKWKTVVFPRSVYERCGVLAKTDPAIQRIAPERPSSSLEALAVDVRVNNPAGDVHPNETQNETTVAVEGDTVCVAYNDFTGGGSGFSRSVNRGAAFVDQGAHAPSNGDPVLAVDADGDFALAHMIDTADAGGFVPDQIVVAFSQDDCQTFPLTHFARADAAIDKPWIDVDRTGGIHDGNVYVCWTEFDAGVTNIRFRRGIPFTDPVVTIKTGGAANLVHGCQVAVAADGDVFVAWENGVKLGQAASIGIRRSPTGGADSDGNAGNGNDGGFLPEVIAANVVAHADDPGFADACGGVSGALGPAATPIRIQEFPGLDTNPLFPDDVYIVYNERIGADVDVVFHRSINDGANWAFTDFRHSGVSEDQFQPAITVAPNGVIKVQWYDRRNDPANTAIELWAALSFDRGLTFTDMKVSDVAFSLDGFVPVPGNCYMGEYNGLTADADEFFHVWGDNRDLVPAGHDGGNPAHLDPNVYFDKQPVPMQGVPAIGDWGLVALAMTLCVAATILFRRIRTLNRVF